MGLMSRMSRTGGCGERKLRRLMAQREGWIPVTGVGWGVGGVATLACREEKGSGRL